jgi:hypothetical protein
MDFGAIVICMEVCIPTSDMCVWFVNVQGKGSIHSVLPKFFPYRKSYSNDIYPRAILSIGKSVDSSNYWPNPNSPVDLALHTGWLSHLLLTISAQQSLDNSSRYIPLTTDSHSYNTLRTSLYRSLVSRNLDSISWKTSKTRVELAGFQ